MGKNTPERQEYIIRNLRFDHDLIDEEEGAEEEVSAKQSSEATTEEGPIEKSEAA